MKEQKQTKLIENPSEGPTQKELAEKYGYNLEELPENAVIGKKGHLRDRKTKRFLKGTIGGPGANVQHEITKLREVLYDTFTPSKFFGIIKVLIERALDKDDPGQEKCAKILLHYGIGRQHLREVEGQIQGQSINITISPDPSISQENVDFIKVTSDNAEANFDSIEEDKEEDMEEYEE